MLRSCYLSPFATPAMTSALKISFQPSTLHRNISTLSNSLFRLTAAVSLLPKTFKPHSLPLSSSSSPPFAATSFGSMSRNNRISLKASASFGSESGSDKSREILVQHLLVKEGDLQLLVDLQKRISQGEDLSDLAVEYSLCPSKDEGGMLGWVRKGQMVPEFEEAAFGAPLNKVVRCKTQFGWHLLQVVSEREESSLQDIQPEELHVKMQDPSFLDEAQLIDVREPDEVEKASLPGFEVLPLRQFGTWGPEVNSKFDPQKDTYVLCHHGMRSLQVAKWLQTQGFRKIFNVAGGIHAYALKADQTIPTY